jgi:DNA-binding NarL/FixJ family response regulator
VDDHSLFRESLSRLLQAEPDFEIAGACGTSAEALDLLQREAADVILLDYDLGNEQGSALLTQVARRGFGGRVLMVTAGMSGAETLHALECGCAGIFLKHSPPAQLVDAIHRVAAGEPWLDSRAMGAVVAGAAGRGEEHRSEQPLTARERAVLNGVLEGLTNKEIGATLQISESSVKAALQQLFDKTGVRTRSQLVRIALEQHAQDWLA